MIWQIASAPFWLSGLVFLVSAALWLVDKDHEPGHALFNFVSCIFIGGGFWYIAARLCS